MGNSKQKTQKMIDEAIKETFPASDVPAWSTSDEYRHKKVTQFIPLKDKVIVKWERTTEHFDYTHYNREALLTFKGKESIKISNPSAYFGKEEYVNSQELFVASISSCYMQTFLAVASLQGYNIECYQDEAVGVLEKDSTGRMRMIEIRLNPVIKFEGIQPTEAALTKMQERASKNCFIVNSICSEVNIHIELEQK